MTDREKEIEKKYCNIIKQDGGWNTYIQIDHQSFFICNSTDRKLAKWFSSQIAIALARLIEKEK